MTTAGRWDGRPRSQGRRRPVVHTARPAQPEASAFPRGHSPSPDSGTKAPGRLPPASSTQKIYDTHWGGLRFMTRARKLISSYRKRARSCLWSGSPCPPFLYSCRGADADFTVNKMKSMGRWPGGSEK